MKLSYMSCLLFICTKNYGMRILCLKLHSKAVNSSYVYGNFVIPKILFICQLQIISQKMYLMLMYSTRYIYT